MWSERFQKSFDDLEKNQLAIYRHEKKIKKRQLLTPEKKVDQKMTEITIYYLAYQWTTFILLYRVNTKLQKNCNTTMLKGWKKKWVGVLTHHDLYPP